MKIYRQYSQIEHNTIIQEFRHMRQTRGHLSAKTIDNHRLERIDISQIPKVVEQFYSNANRKYQPIDHPIEEDEEECVQVESLARKLRIKIASFFQTSISPDESPSGYDPCVWDTLQAMLDDVTDGHSYQFSSCTDATVSTENDPRTKASSNPDLTILDRIDSLLTALNEPNYSIEANTRTTSNSLATLIAAADSCLNDENPPSIP